MDVIPSNIDMTAAEPELTLSRRGGEQLDLLFDHVGSLELDYEITIDEVGVVTNRIDVRKNQAQHMVEWITEAFDDVPVWEVRERADIQYALEGGVSLLEYNDENDMCEVFLSIAAGLDGQFGFAEPEVQA